jgi:hypothetical protein
LSELALLSLQLSIVTAFVPDKALCFIDADLYVDPCIALLQSLDALLSALRAGDPDITSSSTMSCIFYVD